MNSKVLAKIVEENVMDLENISINELMIVAIKSFQAGKNEISNEILNDLEVLEGKINRPLAK